MARIKCAACLQWFDASEEICGDCAEDEEIVDSGYEPPWRLNLAANLAAAGMAATIYDGFDDDCSSPDCSCWYACLVRTMREAVS